nr:hypothetical protein [uncultured Massilia sp.]
MIARGPDRRKGRAPFLNAAADRRRRRQFERRGTVTVAPAPTREVELYGERRRRPDAVSK